MLVYCFGLLFGCYDKILTKCTWGKKEFILILPTIIYHQGNSGQELKARA